MLPSLTPDPRLLAIEDDPTLGAHLFQHLNGSGFEVTWCRDGEEGWLLRAVAPTTWS